MPFDWREYLMVAEQMVQRTHRECHVRTAVSRAYYAALMTIYDKMTLLGHKFAAVNEHKQVIDILEDIDTAAWIRLVALREFRVMADYKCEEIKIKNIKEDVFLPASVLIQFADSLDKKTMSKSKVFLNKPRQTRR